MRKRLCALVMYYKKQTHVTGNKHCIFFFTFSLAPRKQSFGAFGSGDMSSAISVEDMVAAVDMVNLN